MLRPKRNDRPILLNLPKQILEQGDSVVREQGISRTQFLRQAVERNLATVNAASTPCSRICITRA
jgi:metal-responsive CopG/Arc/MetJ family transcriptional regulator